MSRKVNVELVEFSKKVDAAFRQVAGVGYSEIAKDLHGGFDRMKQALALGVDPARFAGQTVADEKLALVADLGADAGPTNIRRAALVEFARENDDWLRGADGKIYMRNDAGDVIRLDAAKSGVADKFGFKVEIARGAQLVPANEFLDEESVAVLDGAEFEEMGSDLDIVDVMAKFEQRYDASAGYGVR